MDEMLGAMYLNNQFDLGQAKGELNGWKNKARKMSNDYRVLHRDWHERGLYARAWKQIAKDLYEERYKKYDRADMEMRLEAAVKKIRNQHAYDPNASP